MIESPLSQVSEYRSFRTPVLRQFMSRHVATSAPRNLDAAKSGPIGLAIASALVGHWATGNCCRAAHVRYHSPVGWSVPVCTNRAARSTSQSTRCHGPKQRLSQGSSRSAADTSACVSRVERTVKKPGLISGARRTAASHSAVENRSLSMASQKPVCSNNLAISADWLGCSKLTK